MDHLMEDQQNMSDEDVSDGEFMGDTAMDFNIYEHKEQNKALRKPW